MDYEKVVRDFAGRTLANLKAIEELAARQDPDDPRVFEVTQLVNSLLGLIIFPQQNFYQNIPEISLEELKAGGWPVPEVATWDGVRCNTLRDLLRYMRNAVAHFNLEFLADSHGQLNGLKLWNTPRGERRGVRNVEVRVRLPQLRAIAEKYIELLLADDAA